MVKVKAWRLEKLAIHNQESMLHQQATKAEDAFEPFEKPDNYGTMVYPF